VGGPIPFSGHLPLDASINSQPSTNLPPHASRHTPSAYHCRPLPAIASLPAKKTTSPQTPQKPKMPNVFDKIASIFYSIFRVCTFVT